MAKLTYVTPMMNEEIFAADEYVAACWTVSCARADASDYNEGYGGTYNRSVTHNTYTDGTGCGHAKNQLITDNADGTVGMVEVQTSGLGDLPCTLTTSDWSASATYLSSAITHGETVYWTTSAADGRVWHHYGNAVADGNHS